MKKIYETPVVMTHLFSVSDIITNSGNTGYEEQGEGDKLGYNAW